MDTLPNDYGQCPIHGDTLARWQCLDRVKICSPMSKYNKMLPSDYAVFHHLHIQESQGNYWMNLFNRKNKVLVLQFYAADE